MQSWVIFMQNAILLFYPFIFIENLYSRLPFHFLSDWPPNANPEKRENVKGFPNSNFSVALYFILEILASSFYTFPSNNIEEFKRTTIRIGHLCSSTKIQQKQGKTNKQTKQKKMQPCDRKFVVKQYINRFKLIMTSTHGKNLWPQSQKWNNDSYLQENQGLQETCSCNLCQVSALKEGSLLVILRELKLQRLE